MNQELTERELQIAELIAWGATRKQIPGMLQRKYGEKKQISINTVNNVVANIYAKLLLNSETELSAWYFCRYEGVDSSHSPLIDFRRAVYSIIFLIILIPQLTNLDQAIRPARTARTARTQTQRSGRRNNDLDITDII